MHRGIERRLRSRCRAGWYKRAESYSTRQKWRVQATLVQVRLHVALGEPVNARSTIDGFQRCSDVTPVLASRRVPVDLRASGVEVACAVIRPDGVCRTNLGRWIVRMTDDLQAERGWGTCEPVMRICASTMTEVGGGGSM